MYNRLFTKILDSSIWLESDATRIVWITLLAAMDEDGYAPFSAKENLARRANVKMDALEKAITILNRPTSTFRRRRWAQGESRRRLVLLKAPYYRTLLTRRSLGKPSHESRNRDSAVTPKTLQSVTDDTVTNVTHSEQSRAEHSTDSSNEESTAPPALVPTAEDIFNAYPLKKERPQAIAAIKFAIKHYGAAFLLERTVAYAKARNGDMEFVPYPQKWFKREGFNDDPMTWKPKSNERQPEKERAPTGEAYRIYQPQRP
jgi:hypothetical protein